MFRRPFKSVGEIRSTRKLQRVHRDVCGPMPVDSIGGKRYFVTFIDDYTRYCKVYFMKNKSEVFNKFKEFELCTTNECGLSIGTLRSDNDGNISLRSSCLTYSQEGYIMSLRLHTHLLKMELRKGSIEP